MPYSDDVTVYLVVNDFGRRTLRNPIERRSYAILSAGNIRTPSE